MVAAGFSLILVCFCVSSALSCSVSRRENDQTFSLPCSRQRIREPFFRLPNHVKAEDVSRIQLNDNLIVAIDNYAFANFSNLDVLELQNNQIESISPFAFIGTRLTRLDLSNNRLYHVPSDALRHLPQLVELELALNRITAIHKGAFRDNGHLEKIDFEGNGLRFIDSSALDPLNARAVRYSPLIFNLASNNLTYLDPALEHASAFASIKFKLFDNPWHCNCSLSFMFFKLKMRYEEVSTDEWPRCMTPEPMHGVSWEVLNRIDFACAPQLATLTASASSAEESQSQSQSMEPVTVDFTRPINASEPIVMEATEGENLHLLCRGYVDPPQDVFWRKDGQALSFVDKRYERLPTLTNVVHFSEKLSLLSISMNDSGTYFCNLTNIAGTSELSITVVVRERPPPPVTQVVQSGEVNRANFLPNRVALNWNDSSGSPMQYLLLIGAIVGGVVLVLAVASFAFYCVKNRYLSYNAVVYRVRKQEEMSTKKMKAAPTLTPTSTQVMAPNGTSHNHSNYLNFSNTISNECSAGLLLARPIGIGMGMGINNGFGTNVPMENGNSSVQIEDVSRAQPDGAAFSASVASFAAATATADARRKQLDSPLISSRSSPNCTQNRTLHHSEMITLKRGYPQALLSSPCHNNNEHQLQQMHCVRGSTDAQCADALVCSCNADGCSANRCQVFFSNPNPSPNSNLLDTNAHLCTGLDVNTACSQLNGNAMYAHYARINTQSPQDSGYSHGYSYGNGSVNANVYGCGSYGYTYGYGYDCGVNYYDQSGVTMGSHLRRKDLEVPTAAAGSYNNNLACSELDDKSPTMSNSTNSTAMFVNRTDVEQA